ncbi:MAG: hypothetical protein ACKVT2_01920 [Saprospiraceae bacterium]
MTKFFNFFLILWVLLLITSCQPGEPVDNRSLLSEQLVGTWVDTLTHKSYRTENGVIIDTIICKDAVYRFYTDGTFSTENDMSLGMRLGGSWTLDADAEVINFVPNPSQGDIWFPSVKTHTWEVESFEEPVLEVNYHLTDSRPLLSGGTLDIKIKRVFVRQQ